jgi:hypothetical protein
MENNQSTQINVIENEVAISAEGFATCFVNVVEDFCDDESMQGICHAISALSEENRPIEAIQKNEITS